MIRRLAVILGVVFATLAITASAHAAPSTPQLKPIPYWVCGHTLNVSWSASTPEPGGQIVAYRLDVGDLTAGTAYHKYTSALGTTIGGLVTGHHYVVRMRALQLKGNVFSWSGTSADTFVASCLLQRIDDDYVAYDPFWWDQCWVCGLGELVSDDPVVNEALRLGVAPVNERIRGLKIDARGEMTIVAG
jgi:hypothetical protein